MKTINFWQKLKPPILGLTPMDGVTDAAYRFIQKKYGQPDVIYTEFTTVEGICHGANKLLKEFLYHELERPIIAQIFGITPKFFRQVAILLCELGFDGIDINMGCPAKNVAQNGAGAALIKNPQLAREIIRETQLGVKDWQNGRLSRNCSDIKQKIWQEVEKKNALLPVQFRQKRDVPVSVKTRLGYAQNELKSWLPVLLECHPAALALHGRTLKQAYSGRADWEAIGEAVELAKGSGVTILGNGDVKSREEAEKKVKEYGVAGVLIGRASFGNPWVFCHQPKVLETYPKSCILLSLLKGLFGQALGRELPEKQARKIQLIFKVALEHAQLFEQIYQASQENVQNIYSFLPMRKHLGWYVKGFPEAKEIRAQLFKTQNSKEVAEIFNLQMKQLLDVKIKS